eukprot:2319657-Rhodomonas_salina.2
MATLTLCSALAAMLTSMLQGPWDFGRGFEETDIAVARARQIAGWLRSAELQTKVRCRPSFALST